MPSCPIDPLSVRVVALRNHSHLLNGSLANRPDRIVVGRGPGPCERGRSHVSCHDGLRRTTVPSNARVTGEEDRSSGSTRAEEVSR